MFQNTGTTPVGFTPPLSISLEHPANWLDPADLDGDGRDDLVVGLTNGLMVLFTKH